VQRWGRGTSDEKPEHERDLPEEGGLTKEEERFLSARADRFAGAKREEKIGPLRSK
jgi:hypothetical protein